MVELNHSDDRFKLPHAQAFSPIHHNFNQREHFENWILANKDDKAKRGVTSPDLTDDEVTPKDVVISQSVTQTP